MPTHGINHFNRHSIERKGGFQGTFRYFYQVLSTRTGILTTNEYIIQVMVHILLWYFLSAAVQFYNRWIFTDQHALPIFTSAVYNTVHFTLATLFMKKKKYFMPWKDYLIHVVPCGLIGGIDMSLTGMGMSNLRLIFYVVIRVSVLAFVLFFLYMLDLVRIGRKLSLVIFLIGLGTAMTVLGEPHFNLDGYYLVQTSAIVSGVRLVLVQLLLSDPRFGIHSALTMLHYLAPLAAISLYLASFAFEGHSVAHELYKRPVSHIAGTILGGFLTFLLQLVLHRTILITSVVTFAVASVAKDIFVVFTVSLFLGEPLINLHGFGIMILGTSFYNYIKIQHQQKEQSEEGKNEDHSSFKEYQSFMASITEE